MLSVLVYPPELEWDSEIWSGNFPAACYAAGGLEACRSWQHVYGTSALLAFVLVMVALLMTVEVFMGRTSWLHRALVVFFTGVQVRAGGDGRVQRAGRVARRHTRAGGRALTPVQARAGCLLYSCPLHI